MSDEMPLIVPLDQIRPNSYNPNQMTDLKFEALKKSLKKFPDILYAQRIIVWKDPASPDDLYEILNGEHRYHACKELGVEAVPVYVVTDITPAQAKLITLALSNVGTEDEDKKIDVIKTILGDYKVEEIAGTIGVDALDLATAVEALISTPQELEAAFDSYNIGPTAKEPTDEEMKTALSAFQIPGSDEEQAPEEYDENPVFSAEDYGDEEFTSATAGQSKTTTTRDATKSETAGAGVEGFIDTSGPVPILSLATWRNVRKVLMWQFDHDGAVDYQKALEDAATTYMDGIDALRNTG